MGFKMQTTDGDLLGDFGYIREHEGDTSWEALFGIVLMKRGQICVNNKENSDFGLAKSPRARLKKPESIKRELWASKASLLSVTKTKKFKKKKNQFGSNRQAIGNNVGASS